MKKLLSILLFVLFGSLLNSAYAEDQINFTVIQNPFRFTTYFELVGKYGYEGRVVKDCFHLRTTYDLYNKEGHYEAQGICRALSLGALYTWAKEIDIYDNHEQKIGFIDGKALTTANIRYDLYDQKGFVAYAYLDYSRQGFTITDPNGVTVAYFKRNLTNANSSEDWEMNIYRPDVVDIRVLKIFSAFIVDFKDNF